ncbi:immunity 21 family protein [Kribbella sp. NBC_01505]|uniref:Imm21 family immunity protein n=1 Tax=Kribbella sp. NBC_01505 TaxID=2903580 RepID=UPI0038666220
MTDDVEPQCPPWVSSMGGPLIVVPVSALGDWRGGRPEGNVTGPDDDYDRACAVEEWAGVIEVGDSASALVLSGDPATTRYLPDERMFLRWLAADSEAELLAAAQVVLNDPEREWESCGVWETDGAAVLMDSAAAGGESEEEAPVDVPAGRWNVLVMDDIEKGPSWLCLVRLVPAT